MVRPKAKELTARELAVMRVFWQHSPITVEEAREHLAAQESNLAYVTVANVVRTLYDKGFLQATNQERPFQYQPLRSFEEVSHSLVGDLVQRLFDGSRQQLLVHMFNKRKLTKQERETLQQILEDEKE